MCSKREDGKTVESPPGPLSLFVHEDSYVHWIWKLNLNLIKFILVSRQQLCLNVRRHVISALWTWTLRRKMSQPSLQRLSRPHCYNSFLKLSCVSKGWFPRDHASGTSFLISIQVEEENNYEFFLEFLPTFAADLPWHSELKAPPITIYFVPIWFGNLFPGHYHIIICYIDRIIVIFAWKLFLPQRVGREKSWRISFFSAFRDPGCFTETCRRPSCSFTPTWDLCAAAKSSMRLRMGTPTLDFRHVIISNEHVSLHSTLLQVPSQTNHSCRIGRAVKPKINGTFARQSCLCPEGISTQGLGIHMCGHWHIPCLYTCV